MEKWIEKELTILVKTYPNLSKKYEELVCVAGIDSQGNWNRIYPVPYRDLKDNQKFKLFQQIKVRALKSSDSRPESFKVEPESISLGHILKSKGPDLNRRRLVVDQAFMGSMCDLLEEQKQNRSSLGAIRVKKLIEFKVEQPSKEERWDKEVILRVSQNSLFNQDREQLEEPKFSFKYKYRCENTNCNTHTQSITAWEIQQAFRNWRSKYSEEIALQMIEQKWGEQMWEANKDTVLFVGNHKKNPQGFLVLGVFWPTVGFTQQQLL